MDILSLSQNQVILGGLLGDSSFYKDRKKIVFSQSEKQLDYLKWKHSFFSTASNIRTAYNRWDDKTYKRNYFYLNIKGDVEIYNFICKHLYSRDNRKKISLKYLQELSPLGLAVWWMDDGNISLSKRNRYGKLSTHCFNYEEHIIIQQYFKKKWNIDATIKSEKEKYYFLRFNATELKKLIQIIYVYVTEIPTMTYKIDLDYKYQKCIGDDFYKTYTYIKEHLQ